MSVIVDDDKEIKILKQVISRERVSIYSLIEYFSKSGIDPEIIVSNIYYLAGRGLLKLEVEISEDGAETIVSTTPLTSIHLKRMGR